MKIVETKITPYSGLYNKDSCRVYVKYFLWPFWIRIGDIWFDSIADADVYLDKILNPPTRKLLNGKYIQYDSTNCK